MSTEPGSVGSSSDDNSVQITDSSSLIQSISYIDGSFNITEGQPSTLPPTISQEGETWTITVNCGRSASSDVATDFNYASGGENHEYCPTGYTDRKAGSLNFYYGITVTFNTTPSVSTTLYLGQGHYGFRNNWWIGGNWINTANGGATLSIINNGTVEQLLSLSGGISSFELKAASAVR